MTKSGCLKIKALLAYSFFLLITLFGYSQEKKQYDKSLSLMIDNDFINYRGTGTDRYYTNGFQLEYNHYEKKKDFFAAGLLLNSGDSSENISHWAITQLMFTPDDIRATQVLCGDRPYAGVLFITRGRTSFNSSLNLTLRSEINLGIIGPYSFAKNTQTWMHEMIRYAKPEGWHNQIKTDIVLNYNINLDKQIYKSNKLQSSIEVASRAGTLFNDLAIGLNLQAGNLYDYPHDRQSNYALLKINKNKKPEVYFFSNAQFKFVLGNSLLQGGFIHSYKNGGEDFYHISEKDINRFITSMESGVVVNKSRWGFTFSENFISKEFESTETQIFGRIKITRRFK